VFFDVLSSFVTIPSTDLAIPELNIGDFTAKLPEGLTSIAETFTNEIESIMDGILNLFEDVECDRYETLRINIPEFIEDALTNFTTSAFPIPNCPVNVEVCTNLRLPGLETFSGGIIDKLDRMSLSEEDLCQDRWSEGGLFVNGGISIPIPIDDLLARGSNYTRFRSSKFNKILNFGKIPTSFKKRVQECFSSGESRVSVVENTHGLR
jgi:hypothetical protein